MANNRNPIPKQYSGVMVSSTFTDLAQHRAVLIKAIKSHGLAEVAMENDSAKVNDVIDSSLQMVQDAAAYVGAISHKYGQTPMCPARNPNALSLTEIEFDEAQRLGRPILLFIMGENHPVTKADVETDSVKIEKLNTFRERAKEMGPNSPVHRVYAVFESLEEFKEKAFPALAKLREYLNKQGSESTEPKAAVAAPVADKPDTIPAPPHFYPEPPYIGSHNFVGRQAQLEILSDWAVAADPHPVLLFDAIGGSGKSMLTWQWTTKHATQIRDDWEGRFWYSFYERGAIMADFCRCALAYITGQPRKTLRKIKTRELADQLLRHLRERPWLFVLDGLERVLVAYQRFDAAQILDEEADKPVDQIAQRDPCDAIRPEDDDLLRALAAAAPSKILITSRLVPRILLNRANQTIPGVRREPLSGLRPPDAEALLRSCEVKGDSQAIRSFLKSHCDCHPLVTGILAGLINDYLPDKGNFDAWAADPTRGGQLNLAELDLVQKRNHILWAALDALSEKSRELLSTLALLSEAVDYETLSAFNPHDPPEPRELERTVRDLERRGLLQYDRQTKRYDIHPVVRGIAVGGLRSEETDHYGQRVVDHFSQQTHIPYDQAETLDDVQNGLRVVRTLLKMGRFQQACDSYSRGLFVALLFNLDAYAEVFSLLKPFFPKGWATLPDTVDEVDGSSLVNHMGIAFFYTGEPIKAFEVYSAALLKDVTAERWSFVYGNLLNISETLYIQNRLVKEERCTLFGLDFVALTGDKGGLFCHRMGRFEQLARRGRWEDAESVWKQLDPMGRNWSRARYRPGDAEYRYALMQFWKEDLTEEHLTLAEQLTRQGKNRIVLRGLCNLRGQWRLEQGRWQLAAESLHEAVRLARIAGINDTESETQLALAKFHLKQLSDPRREAERLSNARRPSHLHLADLWLAIGDRERAEKHALAAYKWAWADGEPYVRRYDLNKATAILQKLGTEIPKLPHYDPEKDQKLPWEDEVVAAIEKLKAEKN